MAQTQDSRSNQKKPTGLGWGSKLKSFFFGKPSPDPKTLAGATAAVPHVGLEGAASSPARMHGAQAKASQGQVGPARLPAPEMVKPPQATPSVQGSVRLSLQVTGAEAPTTRARLLRPREDAEAGKRKLTRRCVAGGCCANTVSGGNRGQGRRACSRRQGRVCHARYGSRPPASLAPHAVGTTRRR